MKRRTFINVLIIALCFTNSNAFGQTNTWGQTVAIEDESGQLLFYNEVQT